MTYMSTETYNGIYDLVVGGGLKEQIRQVMSSELEALNKKFTYHMFARDQQYNSASRFANMHSQGTTPN